MRLRRGAEQSSILRISANNVKSLILTAKTFFKMNVTAIAWMHILNKKTRNVCKIW
jgi:hypothetical protein